MGRLRYHPRWIESGVLTYENLALQIQEYDGPDSDKHTEHYRCATLQGYLRARQALSDTEVAVLLELGALDPDESVRPEFPHSLIHFEGLSDQQFEIVAAALDREGFLRLVSRRRLLRLLSRQEVSEDLLDRAIREGDAEVHRSVLEHPELGRHHVELLAELGNKAVRNKASELLRSRRFRL